MGVMESIEQEKKVSPSIKISGNSFSSNKTLDEMEQSISEIINKLFVPTDQLRELDLINLYNIIEAYIAKYDRIMYAPISNRIYAYFNSGSTDKPPAEGTLLTNLERLLDYAYRRADNKRNPKLYSDTKKAILKIRDHANLAQQQYLQLKQSDQEYAEKFEKQYGKYSAEMSKEMNAQMLTIVGIFTALAFMVFGGISSLDNIFSIHSIPLLKLMVITCLWSLGIVNLVFIFLFCVGKMTNLRFASNVKKDADIIQKYPIVWWTDFLLLSLTVIFSWFYYIKYNHLAKWITCFFNICPEIRVTLYTILLFVIIVLTAITLFIHINKEV